MKEFEFRFHLKRAYVLFWTTFLGILALNSLAIQDLLGTMHLSIGWVGDAAFLLASFPIVGLATKSGAHRNFTARFAENLRIRRFPNLNRERVVEYNDIRQILVFESPSAAGLVHYVGIRQRGFRPSFVFHDRGVPSSNQIPEMIAVLREKTGLKPLESRLIAAPYSGWTEFFWS